MPSSPATHRSSRLHAGSYFHRSQQPLQSLFFLLPLIVLYEAGTFMLHKAAHEAGEPALTIKAYSLLNHFFELFGVTGYYLPGLIVIVVLLCWHLASKPSREDWQVRPSLYVGMGVECVLLAIPLLVWGLVFFREAAAAVAPPESALQATTQAATLMQAVQGHSELGQRIILSIGAGIYEELLFRLIAIALLHVIFVDLLALPHRVGAAAAVGLSALAFGLYHFANLNLAQWSAYDWMRCLFYTLAGVFLAIIYVLRGFGIVAGTHALYDILMAILQWLGGH